MNYIYIEKDMKNIRIGNDIKIEWSLYDGGSAFILEGRDVKVYLKDKYGRKEITDYVISGNMLTWTFHGKNQRRTGAYSLELVVNENENGMITTDACQFVNLVHCSCDVAGSDDNGVSTETIELRSQLSVGGSSGEGGGSYDDTAIWKAVNNKVDKVVGKGLSTNDYTDADKQKLVGLANYDDSGIKKDIEDLSKKVEELEQGGQGGSTPDLSEYLTKEEFNEVSERYATTDSLEDYLTKEEFSETIERYATTDALEGYATTQQLTELSAEVGNKQDTITDLETIRSGAAKGATALQSIPDTYATKTDVSNAIQTAITNELTADF